MEHDQEQLEPLVISLVRVTLKSVFSSFHMSGGAVRTSKRIHSASWLKSKPSPLEAISEFTQA